MVTAWTAGKFQRSSRNMSKTFPEAWHQSLSIEAFNALVKVCPPGVLKVN